MKRVLFISILMVFFMSACNVGNRNDGDARTGGMLPAGAACDTVSIEDMDIKNPFIAYDDAADMYYMTGDNGHVWTSKELRRWVGPYSVLCYDTTSWVGANPVITSPEIHRHNGKYYCMATFETGARHSCTTLVADNMAGPYRSIDSKRYLLDVREMAEHPTFCADEYGVGYMIYNHMGEQNGNGTVQIVRYTNDLGRRMGEAFVMFRASDIPWPRNEKQIPVLESPDLFYSGKEGLGILFTAYCGDEKAVGVAYSATGTLNGPWVVENEPLLKGYGSVTMFNDYDGTPVMVVGKDTVIGGVDRTVPRLIKVDLQFEKLQIKGNYKF